MKKMILLFCSFLFVFTLNLPSYAQLASVHSKFLGNIIAGSTPSNYADYWNQVTPENAGKWGSVEGTRNVYSWSQLDNIYNYTRQRGFPFKGHTLIWGNQAPGWISSLSQSQQAAEVEEWIRLCMQRYPDQEFIDVVNEPLHAPPSYINAIGGSGSTGWDWVVWSFQKARQYDPNCKLLLNEYGIISDPALAQQYVNIANILKAQNLIDGIGIQCHAFNMDNVSTSTMNQVLGILASTGLPIYVSELDMRGDDNTQLSRYQQKFPILWNHSSVQGITLWGYIQGQIWQTEAYLIRSNGTERPALQWLRTFLSGSGGGSSVWLEAECGSAGSLWNTSSDAGASNSQYVTIQPGNNSTGSAPTNTAGHINYSFSAPSAGTYNLFARVRCPSGNDDSFWIRMDGGSWIQWNNITTSSWAWMQLSNTFNLSAGNHTLTVAYREDGAQLDKINLTTSSSAPSGTGSAATNCGGSGSNSIVVRARGTNGSENIQLRVNNNTIATWTLTTSMANYTASTSSTGSITVNFTNDASGRDVQVDYIQVNGLTRQAESQATNTGVWQNSSCGGSNSEWLHCNGYIAFGNVPKSSDEAEETETVPAQYSLHQNYPNPFNPTTTINYELAEGGYVHLIVYDLIGREVKTLINSPQSAGRHTAIFNAEEIPSGVYFYTLQVNGHILTNKMILMK